MEEKKRKIAILSMQRIVNFGSVLQAWSLRELIWDATGIWAEFLDIEDEPALPSRKSTKEHEDYEAEAAYPPGLFQRGKRWTIARLSSLNKRFILAFMKEELGLREEKNRRFDCVVVGSDEVFNHKKGIRLQLHGGIENADNIISYAASCGCALADDILPEHRAAVSEAMSAFSAMSVRDGATARYVSEFYGGDICHHLDPVLLGSLRKIRHKNVALKNYLLVYAYGQRIRTEEEIGAIKAYAAQNGLKTVAVGGSQFWCDLYVPCRPFRVLDWFYHADCVVTDTFHGVIFSVINHKRFAAISRKTNKEKLHGLLKDLGLEYRELKAPAQLNDILAMDTDYERIDAFLDAEREKTTAYLAEHLGDVK